MARAKKNKDAAEDTGIRLVRRNIKSGEVSDRKRGRPHPDFERGYMQDGQFVAGDPTKVKRGPGRPAGSKNKSIGRGIRAAAPIAGEIGQVLDKVVEKAVNDRLRAAKKAAIEAFNRALDV